MSETPAAVGTWIFTLVTPIGELNPEMTLNADGTGRAVLDFGTVEILDAAYDGDSVTFSLKVHMPMGDIDLTVAATVAGDDLTGSVSGSVGTFPLTGVRQS